MKVAQLDTRALLAAIIDRASDLLTDCIDQKHAYDRLAFTRILKTVSDTLNGRKFTDKVSQVPPRAEATISHCSDLADLVAELSRRAEDHTDVTATAPDHNGT